MPSASFRAAAATKLTASPVRSALRALPQANPALWWTGWLNAGLTGLALALLLFDHRLVTGALAWMKPLKFSLSITAFAWTLGWLLAGLPAIAQRSVRRLSGGVAVSMVVEQAVISCRRRAAPLRTIISLRRSMACCFQPWAFSSCSTRS